MIGEDTQISVCELGVLLKRSSITFMVNERHLQPKKQDIIESQKTLLPWKMRKWVRKYRVKFAFEISENAGKQVQNGVQVL